MDSDKNKLLMRTGGRGSAQVRSAGGDALRACGMQIQSPPIGMPVSPVASMI